jgi:hypothetical protein
MKEIIIANMMRTKNKQSFFALHQIQSKIQALYSDIKIEFHILWDNKDEYNDTNDKWEKLINSEIKNLYSYDRKFFVDYVKNLYDLDYENKFNIWPPIYHIIMPHYIRRVLCKDYYLIYDDDILINDNFDHIVKLVLNKIPVLISEPMNINCDKVLINKLIDVFGEGFLTAYKNRNPEFKGFNAGFQGIDLSIYDDFLSKDRFKFLLDLFEYKSIFDQNGNEIWGNERFIIDTQQQSFFGLMNVVFSKKYPHILEENEYFVVPNWGVHPKFGEINNEDENNGWTIGLKSKITHFIGHTQGKGKPKVFLNKVDGYLLKNNFEL